jgi:hypothetical protein
MFGKEMLVLSNVHLSRAHVQVRSVRSLSCNRTPPCRGNIASAVWQVTQGADGEVAIKEGSMLGRRTLAERRVPRRSSRGRTVKQNARQKIEH